MFDGLHRFESMLRRFGRRLHHGQSKSASANITEKCSPCQHFEQQRMLCSNTETKRCAKHVWKWSTKLFLSFSNPKHCIRDIPAHCKILTFRCKRWLLNHLNKRWKLRMNFEIDLFCWTKAPILGALFVSRSEPTPTATSWEAQKSAPEHPKRLKTGPKTRFGSTSPFLHGKTTFLDVEEQAARPGPHGLGAPQ